MRGGGGDDTYIVYDNWGNDVIADATGNNVLDFSNVTSNLTVNLATHSASDDLGNTLDWGAYSGTELKLEDLGADSAWEGLNITPDGRYVLLVEDYEDPTISGEALARIHRLDLQTGAMMAVADNDSNFLANGEYLLASGESSVIGSNTAKISDDGRYLFLYTSEDNAYRVDMQTGDAIYFFTSTFPGYALRYDVSPNGNYAITYGLQDPITGEHPISLIDFTGGTASTVAVATAPSSLTTYDEAYNLLDSAYTGSLAGLGFQPLGSRNLDRSPLNNDNHNGINDTTSDGQFRIFTDLTGADTNAFIENTVTGDIRQLNMEVVEQAVTIGPSNIGVVEAGAGNDDLTGDSAANTLIGGAGNDTLRGAAGNDTYTYDSGDGADQIIDTAGVNDILELNGYDLGDVSFARQGNDLFIDFGGGNTINVQGHFAGQTIEQFDFDDQSVTDTDLTLTHTELLALMTPDQAVMSNPKALMKTKILPKK